MKWCIGYDARIIKPLNRDWGGRGTSIETSDDEPAFNRTVIFHNWSDIVKKYYLNMCPSIINQDVHLIYQTVFPILNHLLFSFWCLPPVQSSRNKPSLEGISRQPSAQAVFPGPPPDLPLGWRWPSEGSMHVCVSFATVTHSHIWIEPYTLFKGERIIGMNYTTFRAFQMVCC